MKKVPQYRNVIFVGAGGTGGYLIRDAIRMFSNIPNVLARPSVVIYDDDIVEPKNIGRQNFVEADIGKHKAEVLAKRYGCAFGVPVSYVNERFTEAKARAAVRTYSTLVIDTVDNKKTRVMLDKSQVDWLSIGNTEHNGQITYRSFGYGLNRSVVTIYPDEFSEEKLQEEAEAESRISCGDNAVSFPQTIAINITGAVLGLNFLYQIFYDKQISSDIIFYDRFNSVTEVGINESPFPSANMNILFAKPEKRDEEIIKQASFYLYNEDTEVYDSIDPQLIEFYNTDVFIKLPEPVANVCPSEVQSPVLDNTSAIYNFSLKLQTAGK